MPLALSGAATGGRRRPLGIAVGLAAAFAFTTLALAYVEGVLPASKVRLIANAVDTNRFRPPMPDERARLLFLGSITYLPLLWGMLIVDRL